MADHDQRLKTLLREFFPNFLQLFFPKWADLFDYAAVEWLDKELHLDPPQGAKRELDLVAKVPLLHPAPNEAAERVILVHVEIEAEDSTTDLHERFPEYYRTLRRKYALPVLPIAVFLKVALEGLGEREHVETVLGEWVQRFRYWYVGLPGLDGPAYLTSKNMLGVALAALMRAAPKSRAELAAEAQRLLANCSESASRKYLLVECLQAYAPLTADDRIELNDLLKSSQYSGVQVMNKTVREEGIDEGVEIGDLRGFRRAVQRQLQKRFGPLSETALGRLSEASLERLEQIQDAADTLESLQSLGLED